VIYHYFGRTKLCSILTDGRLKPFPVIVYEDLVGTKRLELHSVVWFSKNPDLEMSIVPRLKQQGLRADGNGDIWRIGFEDHGACKSLKLWAERHQYPPRLFRWMCWTAKVLGSHRRDWLLLDHQLIQQRWSCLEMRIQGRWFNVDYQEAI